ncbi:hypothetical protein MCEMSE15_00495 [Fimbriimonadaceae bacterium]
MPTIQQHIATLETSQDEAIRLKRQGQLTLASAHYERIVKRAGRILTTESFSPREEEFFLCHFGAILSGYGKCLFAAGHFMQAKQAFSFFARCLEYSNDDKKLRYFHYAELCELGIAADYSEKMFSSNFLQRISIASVLESEKACFMAGGTYAEPQIKLEDVNAVEVPLFISILELNQLPTDTALTLSDWLVYCGIRRFERHRAPLVASPIKYWAKAYGIDAWLEWED